MVRGAVAALMSLSVLLLSTWAAAAAAGDYEPYTPPAQGQVSAPLFVLLAYSAIWVLLLLFVLSVWQRQRRVEDEVARLRRQLERDDG